MRSLVFFSSPRRTNVCSSRSAVSDSRTLGFVPLSTAHPSQNWFERRHRDLSVPFGRLDSEKTARETVAARGESRELANRRWPFFPFPINQQKVDARGLQASGPFQASPHSRRSVAFASGLDAQSIQETAQKLNEKRPLTWRSGVAATLHLRVGLGATPKSTERSCSARLAAARRVVRETEAVIVVGAAESADAILILL